MFTRWKLKIPSLTGDTRRRAYVYVPEVPGEDPARRYPVLYMFDGHNLFFDREATFGKSWGLLEYLEARNPPLIVAAVESNQGPNNDRLVEYCPFSCEMPGVGYLPGKGRAYLDWLVGVFKPEIDKRFPTLPGRAHTFLGGSSMGGLMSLYGLMAYNSTFSRAAALSPSIWFAEGKLDRVLRDTHIWPETTVYLDCGSREMNTRPGLNLRYRKVSTLLQERGVYLTARIVPGGTHSEESWGRQIPFFLSTLLYEY